MFGVVHACRETLGDELIEQWRAHLCGLCLCLRDSRGQLSRALTNTDAVMLSVLVEAQHTGEARRTTAGPCPLRGMRPAQVVPTDAVAARLGATASLTLAAAKARDVTTEREHRLTRTTVRNQAIGLLAGPLRRAALADAPMATAVHAEDVLDDLAGQGALEAATRIGDDILTVTEPTSRAAGQIFLSSAALAERPQNADALRDIGEAFGSLAHLLDAVEDLDADRSSGSFNPIIATGTPLPAVREKCAALVRRIRTTFDRLELSDGRLARALLVDGTHAAVHRAFPTQQRSGRASDATTRPGYPDQQHPGDRVNVPLVQSPDQPPTHFPGEPPTAPPWLPPGDQQIPPPPPQKEPPKPPFWPNVLPWIGVYCTGYACCASHNNPCTGKRHDSGCSNCGGSCDCDCCDCCDC